MGVSFEVQAWGHLLFGVWVGVSGEGGYFPRYVKVVEGGWGGGERMGMVGDLLGGVLAFSLTLPFDFLPSDSFFLFLSFFPVLL